MQMNTNKLSIILNNSSIQIEVARNTENIIQTNMNTTTGVLNNTKTPETTIKREAVSTT